MAALRLEQAHQNTHEPAGHVDSVPRQRTAFTTSEVALSPRMTAQRKHLQKIFPTNGTELAQLKYSENAIDPLKNNLAAARRKALGFADRNLSTATISGTAIPGKTMLAESSGAGSAFHSERNALSDVMNSADIEGFNNKNGGGTGKALKAAGVSLVSIYTERPPCDECNPYMKNLDAEMLGDVTVTYSDELDGYYENKKSKQVKQWKAHCTRISELHVPPLLEKEYESEGVSDGDIEEAEQVDNDFANYGWDTYYPMAPTQGESPDQWARNQGFSDVTHLEYYFNVKNNQ